MCVESCGDADLWRVLCNDTQLLASTFFSPSFFFVIFKRERERKKQLLVG